VIFRMSGVPCYVGKGTGYRWRQHTKHATNRHLIAIFNKEGLDLPCVKVAQGLTDGEACALERTLIAVLGRVRDGGPLVNQTDGGDGMEGYRHQPQSIARLKASWQNAECKKRRLAGLEATRGRKHTPEGIAKLKARVISEETKARMRASSTARFAATADEREKKRAARKAERGTGRKVGGQKGYKHSAESRANMAAAQKGRACPQSTRQAVAQANRKRVISDETRHKMSETRRGRALTPEHCLAISEGKRRKPAELRESA
jgi:hypothetical protein